MVAVETKEITVAVLPFRILSELEFLTPVIQGFSEDLIVNFSKFIGLAVISHFSTQHIKDAGDKAAISRLGAHYLITGSFRKQGELIRVGIHLIRTGEDKVVFSDQHDIEPQAILNTQDEIVQQIVSVLQHQIDYDLLSYSYKKKTVQLAAYENWLIGMDYLKRGSPEDDAVARSYFEAALEVDPNFARAYTGISLSYFNEWSCQLWDRWDVSQKGAQEYALKALERDQNDYVSLAVLGRTYLFSEEFDKAEHYLRKSLRMNPNDADNLIMVAFSMMFLGYGEEALNLYQKACYLNPLHRDYYFAYGSNIYFELGQFEKSLELARKLNFHTYWVDFPAYMAAAYYHLGNYEKMKEYWQLYLEEFEKKIAPGKAPLAEEALAWQKNVAPYQGKTNLTAFWKYIAAAENTIVSKPAREPERSTHGAFLLQGDMWEVTFQGKTVLIKDKKGNHDIARLLATPGKELHCSELMGAVLVDDNPTAMLDQKAKSAYEARIRDLQSEIKEAEEMNNVGLLSSLNEEYEQLLDHLSSSMGLGGQARQAGSSVEKARTAVTWRIRSAIKKIKKAHPALAKHLSHSIRTGTFCSYQPESPVDWKSL